MKRSWLRSWLGTSLLGLATVAGCRHAQKCECCCDCGSAQAVVVVPEAPRVTEVTAVAVEPPAPKVAAKPASLPDDSQVQQTVAHKVEPAHDVLATVVAPDSKCVGGGIAGTMALTAAEAEAMGIRPGYTPGALYTPGTTPPNPVLHLTGAQEETPAGQK